MECPSCHSEMTCRPEDYRYIESGLDNVMIKGLDVYRCQCGENVISIPAISALNTLIGRALIKKSTLLTGKEIRFLRKNIGLTATRLSQIMGADIATISRWENAAQSISKEHDRMLRLVYAELKNLPGDEKKELIEQFFPEITTSRRIEKPIDIHPWMWTRQGQHCHSRC